MPQLKNQQSQAQYCIDQVAKYDHDRYLCIMLAPRQYRQDLFSLFAFNEEIARIREQVNESLLGQMRLRWWHETIEKINPEQPRPSGLAGTLFDVIIKHNLSKQLFYELLDARASDLDDIPPPSMDALIQYCSGTSSTLIRLSQEIILGSKYTSDNQIMNDAARDCGIAWALIGTIRSIPFQLSQGRCMLPRDLLRTSAIDWTTVSPTNPPDRLKDVIRVLAQEAEKRIMSTRDASKGLSRKATTPLISLPVAAHYLKVISSVGYDVFDERLQHSHSPKKTFKLLFASWFNKI